MTENYKQDAEKALEVLKQGGTILYPTDTVWGIGCDATNAEAVAKVYSIKKRKDAKALIVLVADERDIIKYTASPDPGIFEYLRSVKKPTTVIYNGAIGFSENLRATDGTVAIRICKDPFCRTLIKRFGKPIVSTSANISGDKTPGHFDAINEAIKESVDYVVQYRQDDLTPAEPSSVVRWVNGNIDVIRT